MIDVVSTFGYRHEAMTDLVRLLSSLVDVKGNILIPGVNDDVLPLTEEEAALYGPIDFDPVSDVTFIILRMEQLDSLTEKLVGQVLLQRQEKTTA